MKKILAIIITAMLLFSLVLFCFSGCTKKEGRTVIEYRDPSGKVSADVNQSFLSFMIATLNFQHGASSISDASVWDMKVDETSDATVRDLIRSEAVSYASLFLKAEYLHDHVYGIGLEDERNETINKSIDSMIALYGSEDKFNEVLSVYGTNVASLRRYMELSVKQTVLEEYLYSENGPARVSDEKLQQFFAENYFIADYIYVSLTGGVKDDGSTIPLTDEEKNQKRAAADSIMAELLGGLIEFDDAMNTYSEADYSSVYPDGYFIPADGTAAGLNNEISDAVRQMKVDEIKLVETSNAVYIVKKRQMNPALYNSKEGFAESLRGALESDDFLKQLETADGISVNNEAVNELNPAAIPALDIESLVG